MLDIEEVLNLRVGENKKVTAVKKEKAAAAGN